MPEPVEVIYENGVFRPVTPLTCRFQEQQRLTILIEPTEVVRPWLADANPTVSLDTVRQALASVPAPLAQFIHAEREER